MPSREEIGLKERKKQNSPRTRKRRQGRGEAKQVGIGKPAQKPNTFPLDFASPLIRVYAYITDWAIFSAVFLISVQIFGVSVETVPFVALGMFLGYFAVPTILWGRTVGKAIIGVVVVDDEGYPCGLRGVPREIFGRILAVGLALIGIIWILFDAKKQGFHDKIAGTYVVYHPKSGIANWFRKKS